jgi:two-component system, LytTR family, response regulator AlgR
MNTINIIIADDETPARNRLRDLLSEIPHVTIVAEAHNGRETLDLVSQYQADLILLDIRMPEIDGIEAAQHIQKMAYPPKIIFTTAYDTYAIRAFDLNAIDYLLKPIRLERLETAINKARVLKSTQLEALKPLQKTRSHLSILERGRIILIPIEEIIYFRAEQKYTTIRTLQREYLSEESLTQLETEFSERLLRLHRNCLVAKQFVSGFEKRTSINEQGQPETQWVALLKNIPETLAVSRRQQHLIKEIY